MQTALRLQKTDSQIVSEPSSRVLTRQIKVLHVINDLSVGGAEMMLYKLLSDRDCERFQPQVLLLRNSGSLRERVGGLDVGVYSVGINSHVQSVPAAWRLARLVRSFDPDVIHGWMYHGSLAAQFAASCLNKPVPVLWSIRQSIYSLQHEKKSTVLAIRAGARFSARPQAIVYNSRVSAAQHGAIGYQSENSCVIPNGFDTESFAPSDETRASVRAELNVPDDTVLIGMVGRFHPAKDHDTFLQAAALVSRSHHRHRFVLCGTNVDAENSYLRKRIANLGLESNILLLGQRNDMDRLMPAFDLVVSSSFEEGFPNVVGEAMSSGVPCVVTDVSDLPWVVGNTGMVVPSRNPDALAGAICNMMELGTEVRTRMGAAARRRVIEKFQIHTIKKLYEDLYVTLIAGKRGQFGPEFHLSGLESPVAGPMSPHEAETPQTVQN